MIWLCWTVVLSLLLPSAHQENGTNSLLPLPEPESDAEADIVQIKHPVNSHAEPGAEAGINLSTAAMSSSRGSRQGSQGSSLPFTAQSILPANETRGKDPWSSTTPATPPQGALQPRRFKCFVYIYFRHMYFGKCFGSAAGSEWRKKEAGLCAQNPNAHQRHSYSLAFPTLLQSEVAAAGWLEGPCTNPSPIQEIHRRRRLSVLDYFLSLRFNSIYYINPPIQTLLHFELTVSAFGFMFFAVVRAVIWANPSETNGFFYTFLQWDTLITSFPGLFRGLREYIFNNVPSPYKTYGGRGGCDYYPFPPLFILRTLIMLSPTYTFWWTNTLSLLDRCWALGFPVWYHKVMSGKPPATRFRRLLMPLFVFALFYAWQLAPGPGLIPKSWSSFPFFCRYRFLNRSLSSPFVYHLETCCDGATHRYTPWIWKLVFLGFLPLSWRQDLNKALYAVLANPFLAQGLLWLWLLILLLRLRRKHKTAGVAAMEKKDKAALRMTLVLAACDLLIQALLYISDSVFTTRYGLGPFLPQRLEDSKDLAVVDAGLTRYALGKDVQVVTNLLLVIMPILSWAILPCVSGTFRHLLFATGRKIRKRFSG